MLKLLGAMMVFLAGTLIGFYMAHHYANRPKQIRQIHQALQRLETEISYGFTPLPEALKSISNQSAEPLASLFAAVSEELESHAVHTASAWDNAIRRLWTRTSMREAEKEILLHLGTTLGTSDREDQIKHLRLAMSQLQYEEDTALEDQRRYAKMWKSLGMLGGALVVLLMY